MLKGNEAFSRVVIDAQLADQGWNTQDRAIGREYRLCLITAIRTGKGFSGSRCLAKRSIEGFLPLPVSNTQLWAFDEPTASAACWKDCRREAG
jgi:hypothetical protein